MTMIYLFLDDERIPSDVFWLKLPRDAEWVIVRNQQEFRDHILQHGIPRHASFDNDLGDGQGEGRDCAKWMCEAIMDGELDFNPDMRFTVHSKNVVAAEWITQYLESFWKIWPEQA